MFWTVPLTICRSPTARFPSGRRQAYAPGRSSLMTATEIGTLFLDDGLKIKLFTPAVAKIINIENTDIGRPISKYTHRLNYDDMERDAHKVLKSLIPFETELSSSDRRWFTMRISPYRTVDNKIDGVVITFTDITARKETEEALAGELRAMTRLRQLSTAVVETNELEAPLLAILDYP
jgi:two-component system CheB/CheR fusion protein